MQSYPKALLGSRMEIYYIFLPIFKSLLIYNFYPDIPTVPQ